MEVPNINGKGPWSTMGRFTIISVTALGVEFTAISTVKISGSLISIEEDAFRLATAEEINIRPSGIS